MKKIASLSVALATVLYAADTTLEPVTVTAPQESAVLNPALGLAAQEPDVDIRRTTGKPQEIVIRGLGGEDLSVTAEGAATHGACPNRMDPPLSHINSAKIEGYEITKGPYNVRQIGTLGGSAEIKFKPLPSETTIEAEAGAASFERQDLSVYGGGGNETFGIAAGVQKHQSGVYKDGDGNFVTDAATTYKTDIDEETLYEKQGAFVQAGFKAGGVKTLIEYDTLATDHALFPNRPMDETSTDTTQTALSVEGTEGALEGLKLRVYRNYVDHVMDNHTFRSETNTSKWVDAKGDSTVSGLRLSKTFSLGDNGFEIGAEQMSRAWEISRYAATTGVLKTNGVMVDAETALTGLYAMATVPVKENCKLEIGLRADSVTIDDSNNNEITVGANTGKNMIEAIGNDYEDSVSDTLVSAYVKRVQDFNENWRFVAALGTAQRPLAPNEVYIQQSGGMLAMAGQVPYGVQGNPDLKSPKNSQLDLSVEHKNGALNFKAGAFYSILTDYVYETNVTTVANNKTYTNIDATMMGFDAKAQYRFTQDFSLKAGLAWQKGEKDDSDNGSENLAGMPPLRYSLHALYEQPKWKVSLEMEAAAKDTENDEGVGEVEMDGYTVYNLRGEMAIAKGFSLTAGIENLTDEAYALYNSYSTDPINPTVSGAVLAEPGRVVYASVKYRY